MSEIIFSCIIPCRDINDSKLFDLISSIKGQDFPQDQIEILTIAEGDSEQAKAIGIRRAQGKICAMFCADNYLSRKDIFSNIYSIFDCNKLMTGCYSKFYSVCKNDNSLNRYFSLMGNNDPIAFYLNKADRRPVYEYVHDETFTYFEFKNGVPSLGDNGFFYWNDSIKRADLDHYYPMDCAEDLRRKGEARYLRINIDYLWHRTTDGNLIKFLIKRYKYARDLHCDRKDRRWNLIRDCNNNIEHGGLFLFVASTVTIIPAVCISIRGFIKIPDWAWFWHWPVCFGFLITYTFLAFRNLFKYGNKFYEKGSLCQLISP